MVTDDIIVVGLGEVGKPLLELIRGKHGVIGVDIEPVMIDGRCSILHICYGFNDRFVDATANYIKRYRPGLTIINSTVPPGTTRAVYRLTHSPIVYSPVRGKHFKMKRDMLHYTKFVGGIDPAAALAASQHFESIGMVTKVLSCPEAAELAKLTETTYFGLLIVWAQEVERYCEKLRVDYDEVVSLYDEIAFLPRVKYLPGVIGGHCVMPNLKLLSRLFDSDLLKAMEKSNDLKAHADLLESVPAARQVS
jgi:UDP-N-acetyl-D-mannosaminuronate dehydrogenase